MPTEVLMPALSPTMTEGNLARWLKKEGDTVAAGDVIAEIETDKATMEVEAVDEGTLGKILVPEGAEGVAVNTPIALLLAPRTDLTVITLGGRVRAVTLGEVDSFAIRSLRDIHVDVAFLGTNGFSVPHGLTTPDQSEAEFKRETLRVGETTVLLADRTKLGQASVWRYGELDAIDVLVTDAEPDAELSRALSDAEVEVWLA